MPESVPYNTSSRAFSFACATFVESIVKRAVGLKPATSTGVVVTLQLKLIASGESFTVLYPFSDGDAVHP